MRLRSVDVFDTLLTRRLAEPVDLFRICGRELQASGITIGDEEAFATSRIEAETRARRWAIAAEPTLEEIYSELATALGWSPETSKKAAELEMAIEAASLVAVPGADDMLRGLRAEGDRVLYLSDMYLPSPFVKDILAREGFWQEGDELYLSNELRRSKGSGEMFRYVREKHPARDWLHVGDNEHSDFRVPRQLGISARLLQETHLSPYEAAVRGNSRVATSARSTLAATMRLTRLRSSLKGKRPADLGDLTAKIAGPLLLLYVAWILRRAQERNLSRLYFVSRDGEVLLRVAKVLCKAWGLDIECRYLYGSRQAWHVPAITELADYEKSWLLQRDVPLTTAVIADRLGVPEGSVLRGELYQKIASIAPPDIPLDPVQSEAVWAVLTSPDFSADLSRLFAENRATAARYFQQEGLLDTDPVAIVDIGWKGNLQKSLSYLLEEIGHPHEVVGFYLGLVESSLDPARFLSFWEDATGTLFVHKRALQAEILTAGCEGSVIGYDERDGVVHPRLNRLHNLEALEWGLDFFQESVERFAAEAAARLSLDDLGDSALAATVCDLFLDLCDNPSRRDAATLGRFRHAVDQTESYFRVVVDENLSPEVLAAYAWRKDLWHDHPWIEGQIAVTPSWPLRLAKFARSARARLARPTRTISR